MSTISNTRKYGFLQAPFMSFFSKDLYTDVTVHWSGCGALYMLMLLSISWLVSCITFDKPFIQLSMNPDTPAYLQQLPDMTMKDGVLSINKPYPCNIVNTHDKSQVYVTFVKEFVGTPSASDPALIITKDAMIAGAAASQSQPALEFSKLKGCDFQLTGNQLIGIVGQFALWLPIGLYAFGIIPVFLAHLLQMCIYGGLAMAIASGFQTKITFVTGMRLAAIAMTPAIMLNTGIAAAQAFGVSSFPGLGLVAMAVSVLMVVGFLILAGMGAKDAQLTDASALEHS